MPSFLLPSRTCSVATRPSLMAGWSAPSSSSTVALRKLARPSAGSAGQHCTVVGRQPRRTEERLQLPGVPRAGLQDWPKKTRPSWPAKGRPNWPRINIPTDGQVFLVLVGRQHALLGLRTVGKGVWWQQLHTRARPRVQGSTAQLPTQQPQPHPFMFHILSVKVSSMEGGVTACLAHDVQHVGLQLLSAVGAHACSKNNTPHVVRQLAKMPSVTRRQKPSGSSVLRGSTTLSQRIKANCYRRALWAWLVSSVMPRAAGRLCLRMLTQVELVGVAVPLEGLADAL